MKSVALPFIGLAITTALVIGLFLPAATIRPAVDRELLTTYNYEKAQYGLVTLLSLMKNGKSVYEILSTKALLNSPEGLSAFKSNFDQLMGKSCISTKKDVQLGLPDLTGYNEGPTEYKINTPQTYEVAVQNLGDVDAGTFNIRWLVDGAQVGAGNHKSVPKNSTVNNDNDNLIHTFPDSGPHAIEYIIDTDNFIQESDENNNKISFYVSTQSQPEFLKHMCDPSNIEFNAFIVLPYNKNSLTELIRIGVG